MRDQKQKRCVITAASYCDGDKEGMIFPWTRGFAMPKYSNKIGKLAKYDDGSKQNIIFAAYFFFFLFVVYFCDTFHLKFNQIKAL